MPQLHAAEAEVQRPALDAARASAAEIVALADLSLTLQKAASAEVTAPNPNNPSDGARDIQIRFARKVDADSFLSALIRVVTGRAPTADKK